MGFVKISHVTLIVAEDPGFPGQLLLMAQHHELILILVFYRQHSAQRKPAGISFTQRPILRFFAPQGRHVAPMGVKFGMAMLPVKN